MSNNNKENIFVLSFKNEEIQAIKTPQEGTRGTNSSFCRVLQLVLHTIKLCLCPCIAKSETNFKQIQILVEAPVGVFTNLIKLTGLTNLPQFNSLSTSRLGSLTSGMEMIYSTKQPFVHIVIKHKIQIFKLDHRTRISPQIN